MTINPSLRGCSLSLFLLRTKKPGYYSSGSHSHVDDVVQADSVIGVANLEDTLNFIGLRQCLKNDINGNFLLPSPIKNVGDGKDSAQIVFNDLNLPNQLEPRYRYYLSQHLLHLTSITKDCTIVQCTNSGRDAQLLAIVGLESLVT